MHRTKPLRGLPGLALAVMIALASPAVGAGGAIELEWNDLVPDTQNGLESAYDTLGVVQHDQIAQSTPEEATDAPVTEEYNGQRVRIPGYVVPLEFDEAGVTSFILVPYVGACIHVPPPPANQLILVSSERPATISGLFEPVWVTGTLDAASTATELADIGYTLAADTVEPYE